MAKEIKGFIKLQIEAGKANPAPPIGPALGQHGVNIMEFCKAYNDKTKDKMGQVIPVIITVYKDRTFTFITKTPPVSRLLLKAINKEKGSGQPNKEKIGEITMAKIKEIAQLKLPDLNALNLDSAVSMVAGTARSMGIVVKD